MSPIELAVAAVLWSIVAVAVVVIIRSISNE
jgi:hypothetical protein